MRFSVITPCLNRADLLGATIESVLAQEYKDFEHWIIDGGSTDGTLELLKRYSHLRVVSEPDRGLYDAINKGVRLATGEIIVLLNSDDLLVPGAFSLSAQIFENAIGTMIVSAGSQIFRITPEGTEIEMHRYADPREYTLSLRNVTIGIPNLNARFFRRKVFEQIGDFDLAYSIAADRDFLIRAAVRQLPDAPVGKVLYRYRWHPGSLTMSPAGDSLITGMRDGLRIIADSTNKFPLSTKDKAFLNQWGRQCRATEMMAYAVQGRAKEALQTFLEGARRDPKFIMTSIRLGLLAIGRRLRTWWRMR